MLTAAMAISLMPVAGKAETVENSESDITITPQDITGYVGGNSLNGGHTPKLRFAVDLPAGVSLDDLSFKIYTETGGKESRGETLEANAINDTYCLFPELGAGFETEEGNTDIQRGNYIKLVDNGENTNSLNGTYNVEKRTGKNADWDDWYIKATDEAGKEYTVDMTENSTVTVRQVSESENKTIYSNIESYVTPVVSSDASIEKAVKSAEDGMAIAVEKKDTTYNYETNGQSELGLIGDDGSTDTAEVALLCDDLLTDSYANNQIEDRVGEEDYDYNEMKYLDLVNVKDGNAVVTTDKDIDIYWPYPDGMTMEDAQEMCEFEILHFEDMDRGYTTNSNDPEVKNVETIIPECTEYGLKFSTKNFSPYVLLWKVIKYPTNKVLKVNGPEGESVSFDDENITDSESVSLLKAGNNTGAAEIVSEEVTEKNRTGNLPDTGEKADVSMWTCMMLVCGAGAVLIEVIRRRFYRKILR
jgi:hypothetical protein